MERLFNTQFQEWLKGLYESYGDASKCSTPEEVERKTSKRLRTLYERVRERLAADPMT